MVSHLALVSNFVFTNRAIDICKNVIQIFKEFGIGCGEKQADKEQAAHTNKASKILIWEFDRAQCGVISSDELIILFLSEIVVTRQWQVQDIDD